MDEQRNLTTCLCPECQFTFHRAEPGQLCLHSDCKGTLQVWTEAAAERVAREAWLRRPKMRTQEDIARAVHALGLPTNDWLLIYASEDGQLYSVSPMQSVKQAMMARAVAISFKEQRATQTLHVVEKK